MEHFKLIITIVDRGKGTKAVDLYRSHHLHFDFACLGGHSQLEDFKLLRPGRNRQGAGLDAGPRQPHSAPCCPKCTGCWTYPPRAGAFCSPSPSLASAPKFPKCF